MISEDIKTITQLLENNGVDEARLLAEYTLAEITGMPRLQLNGHGKSELTAQQQKRLEKMTTRLARHEPLQYVLGYTEFMSRKFKTDRRALIPRPETEELLQTVLDTKELWKKSSPTIADVGTGSGCIAISLLIEHPDALITAIDTNPPAIELAKENEKLHNLCSVEWMISDLLNMQAPASLDAVVSNPPYIARPELDSLDRNIREYEPLSALDGGADGLDVYRQLASQSQAALKPGGWIFLEIGEDQGEAVSAILASNGFGRIEVKPDLAGRDRIATARLNIAAMDDIMDQCAN